MHVDGVGQETAVGGVASLCVGHLEGAGADARKDRYGGGALCREEAVRPMYTVVCGEIHEHRAEFCNLVLSLSS